MITSLQNFFLKHNKWLFGSLLIVIIVTFVLTIGPSSFFGGNTTTQRKALNYYGYDLSSEQDQRAMAYTAEVSAILNPELQLRREQLMDYAYLRVAGLGIASQLGIPQPDKETLSSYVESLSIFADPQTGVFSAESYNRMVEMLQINGRFTREAIARALREDYVLNQVREAFSGPDYSLPFENQQSFIDQGTQYTVSLATYAYADFAPEITPSDEALLQFFNENPSQYEIQETIAVTVLRFEADAYQDAVPEPADTDLEIYFATNQSRYQPASQEEGTEATPVALADVREQVVSDWKSQEATRLAAEKSQAFSLKLWQENIALDSEAFTKLIEDFEVSVSDIAPYTRENPPISADLSAQLLNSMWIYANNPTRYFSDAAQTSTGAVLLVNKGLTEARMPAFEEVREYVEDNYRAAEKRRLFTEKGTELRETITARLESESFEAIAESLNMTVQALDQFDGVSVPQELQQGNMWDQTMHLASGQVSPMVTSRTEGTFSYIVDKVVPELDVESEEYKAFVAQRKGALSNAMGWARLREITDNSLSSLMGSSPVGAE
jgi:hypothetical protein